MPIHDWTRVEAGIFHAFHHNWITAISDALNSGLLPTDYYALPEQEAAGFGPDILTLQASPRNGAAGGGTDASGTSVQLAIKPKAPSTRFTAQSNREFFRRKKSNIAVRHVSGDDLVAVIEIISPGNKSSKNAFRVLLDKACELLEHKIHLLLLDLFPPTRRDPRGLHSALWEVIDDAMFEPPADKPLTLVAYESGPTVKAYIEPVAVGDTLPDMPLVLEPGDYVLVPLESTYETAWEKFPRRWREVVEGTTGS